MSTFCCERFAKEAGELQAPVGGGMQYPSGMRPNAQFEMKYDGVWAINGCCGGGCYVVDEMKFCPFCGSALTPNAGIQPRAAGPSAGMPGSASPKGD